MPLVHSIGYEHSNTLDVVLGLDAHGPGGKFLRRVSSDTRETAEKRRIEEQEKIRRIVNEANGEAA